MQDSFVDKAKDPENTVPMSELGTKIFLSSVMYANEAQSLADEDFSLTMAVVKKRIESFKLPIEFDTPALMAVEGLAEGNPGKAVAILIDCLTHYEGGKVTPREIAMLYPWGFYNDSVFVDYVDNYLKPRKVKWSELY